MRGLRRWWRGGGNMISRPSWRPAPDCSGEREGWIDCGVAMRLGLGEWGRKRFLLAAQKQDCGEAGCKEIYGFGLKIWAQKLLGAGEWDPPTGIASTGEVV